MTRYLFVYGTLSPEHAPPEIADVVNDLKLIAEGFVHGWLYDLGKYPGAILDEDSPHKIFGQVFSLPDNDCVLKDLDEYEEFNPHNLKNSLFVRKRTKATLTDGQKIECWIYVYNKNPKTAMLISGGDYAEYKAA
jgi:gamma-glutamylcyclotransferase (GGCT)/AIG2-like uncharacterized protein YtfP